MIRFHVGRLPRSLGALVLCLAVPVAGCAPGMQPGPGGPQTADQNQAAQQANTFNETAIAGAIIGGVLGALTGGLIGGNVTGALIGSGAGALVGGGAGVYLAHQQETYASEEQRLDATIAELRSENQNLTSLIESAQVSIAADKARIESIDKQLAAGKLSKEQARAELASVDGNIQQMQITLSNFKNRQNSWQNVAAESRKSDDTQRVAVMDQEIQKLVVQIGSLESELDTLVQRRKISPVG